MSAQNNLNKLGITLPTPPTPVANYVGWQKAGNLVIVSGQVPLINGERIIGKVGKDLTKEQAVEAARICGINIIAQANQAVNGNIDKLKLVRLGIFVNCTDDFTEQPLVGNGVSDLMVEVFGDNGKHARAAVGTNSLPLGVPVEVDAIFEVI